MSTACGRPQAGGVKLMWTGEKIDWRDRKTNEEVLQLVQE